MQRRNSTTINNVCQIKINPIFNRKLGYILSIGNNKIQYKN